MLMGNGARVVVHGVGTVDLKLTLEKTVQLKNVQHAPSIRKNLISGSLLCRDGYKLVFESNNCILSKYGTFVGKSYESGGLFRLSLSDACFNSVSHDTETNIWHSWLCHIKFGFMTRLAGMNLILNLIWSKVLNAMYVYNQSNLVSLTRLLGEKLGTIRTNSF